MVIDARARFTLAVGRAATAAAEALVALVDYAADRTTAAATPDPLWGRVDGEHLPPWISREQFRDACAAGVIADARKVGRLWTAPRHAVEAWALDGAKTASNDSDDDLAARAIRPSRGTG